MSSNKSVDIFTSINRVKVWVLNNLSFPYYGKIIGRDSEFIYLDTGEYEGVVFIPISNISKIIEVTKKEVLDNG